MVCSAMPTTPFRLRHSSRQRSSEAAPLKATRTRTTSWNASTHSYGLKASDTTGSAPASMGFQQRLGREKPRSCVVAIASGWEGLSPGHTSSLPRTPQAFRTTSNVFRQEDALQKIEPAGHYRLAVAANESPGDYAVSLFRHSP